MAIGDIKAGKAYVEIGTDNRKLDKGLAAAQQRMMNFGKSIAAVTGPIAAVAAAITGAGAALNAFIIQPSLEATKRASELVDAAEKLGIGVEVFQEMGFAAGRLGVEVKTVTDAIGKMKQNLGQGGLNAELRNLGISIDDIKGQDAQEQFFRIIDALRQVQDENDRAAYTVKIFGKSGQELNQVINAGSSSLRQMAQEGRNLGIIMGEDLAKGFEQAGDAADDAKKAIEALWNRPEIQERVAAYAELISEIVTLGKADTEFWNKHELNLQRSAAQVEQLATDRENAVKFAEAQADEAERQAQHAKSTMQYMADTLATMEKLGPAMQAVSDELARNEALRAEVQRIFMNTRTPEERAEMEKTQLRELWSKGLIKDEDLYRRRFRQILQALPQQLAPVTRGTAAGTFNPFAAKGLSDNQKLTQIAQQQVDILKKIDANTKQGAVFH